MATAFGGEPLGNIFMPALFESRAGYLRRQRYEQREFDASFTPKPSLLERLRIVPFRSKQAPKTADTSIFRGRQQHQSSDTPMPSSRSSSRASWRSMPFLRRRSSNSTMASVDSHESTQSVSRSTTRETRARAALNRLSVVQEDAAPSQPNSRLTRMHQMGLFDETYA